MTHRPLGSVVLLGALLHCASPSSPPAPQLVLYLDTDAPLPSGSGTSGPLDPVPLFNRVRFDATPSGVAGSCGDCSREFDVTRELVAGGAVSFGVLPPLAGHGTLRVRLFRGSTTVEGEPAPGSTIDITFALPAVSSSDGLVSRTLFMPTDQVGTPLGTTSPVATLPGRPSPPHVGTWPGAVRKNCATAPRVGEVCVPGGAYWMGNVAAVGQGDNSGDVSRLVILSPFYVDETEMTVATFRRMNVTVRWKEPRPAFPRLGRRAKVRGYAENARTVGGARSNVRGNEPTRRAFLRAPWDSPGDVRVVALAASRCRSCATT